MSPNRCITPTLKFIVRCIMKTISFLGIVALMLALASGDALAKNPRTKSRTVDRCYKIKCSGSSSACFIFSLGHGIEVGYPGVASITQIPCSQTSVGGDPTPTTAVFAVTDGDSGIGWTNADGLVNESPQECDVTVYDDSPEFTSLSAWRAAQ